MPQHRKPRMVFHYKIDHDLTPADRSAYESVLTDPKTTVDIAHAWLHAHGYPMSRSAVARHRRRVLKARLEARTRVACAAEYARYAAKTGPQGLWSAALIRSQQLLFTRLMDTEPDELT